LKETPDLEAFAVEQGSEAAIWEVRFSEPGGHGVEHPRGKLSWIDERV
jgi:hypothetical protein